MSYILLCSSTLRAVGDHGSVAAHEVSLELGALRSLYTDNLYTDDVPDPWIARDTLDVILQEARREPDFQRPAWLSSEIMAWVVGAAHSSIDSSTMLPSVSGWPSISAQTRGRLGGSAMNKM